MTGNIELPWLPAHSLWLVDFCRFYFCRGLGNSCLDSAIPLNQALKPDGVLEPGGTLWASPLDQELIFGSNSPWLACNIEGINCRNLRTHLNKGTSSILFPQFVCSPQQLKAMGSLPRQALEWFGACRVPDNSRGFRAVGGALAFRKV